MLAFGKQVVAVKSQDGDKPSEVVVTDLLSLRGHGTTDLAGALRAAAQQLNRDTATRKVAILLSDCRPTVDGDVVGAAVAVPELVIVAPEQDSAEAISFAQQCHARVATVAGPSQIAEALAAVLER